MGDDPIRNAGDGVLLLNHELRLLSEEDRCQARRQRNVAAGADDKMGVEIFQLGVAVEGGFNQTVGEEEILRGEEDGAG